MAEEAGSTTEELASALVESWPIAIALIDARGRITHLNHLMAELLGAEQPSAIGRTVEELVPGSPLKGLVDVALSGQTPPPPIDFERDDPEGRRRWEMTAHTMTVKGEVLGVIRGLDLAERRSAEDLLRRAAKHQSLVAELGRRALQAKSEEELLDHTVTVTAEALVAPYAAVIELDRARGLFVLRAGVGWQKGTLIPKAGQAAYTIERGEAVSSPDVTAETRFPANQILLENGIRAAATVVVDGPDGKPWGVLGVHSPIVNAFSDDDLHVLAVIANVLGAALVRLASERELRESEERRRFALTAGGMGTWTWDLESNVVVWDDSLKQVFGLSPDEFDGSFDHYLDRVHPDDRDEVVRVINESLDRGGRHEVEHRIVLPSAEERWISGRGHVVLDDDGVAVGMVGIASDITDRRLAEQEREALRQSERAARERLEFLARASEILSRSLDLDQTLHGLASLAIERFADWCAIDLVDEAGRPSSLVVAHADPSMVELARNLRERYPSNPDAPAGSAAVVRSGEPQLVREVSRDLLVATANGEEHLRLLESLGLRSIMIVPLVSRSGRVLGTVSFVSSQPDRLFDDDDLVLASELGRRAGMAVERAQLFSERDHVAAVLQASLLPPTRPDIPGLELSALYRPAAAGPVIGGDFYDFFEADDGVWSVAIGDVCGKGADAAALTGLARHTIRAASMREPSPAAVLRDLNDVLVRNETTQRFCTVALARLERMGTGFVMTASCGGHPAPVLVRRDGTVEAITCQGSLIGILPSVELSDSKVALAPGDAVVFYTDGVTEARVSGDVFGEEGLISLLQGAGPRHPDELAAAIHEAVVRPDLRGTRDDVAIVVLRVAT